MLELGSAEKLQQPEVSRAMAKFIDAVENSGTNSPVSLELIAEKTGGWRGLLDSQLGQTDELYDERDKLFAKPLDLGDPDQLNAIFELTRKSIANANIALHETNAAYGAIGLLQFAAAAARYAEDPTAVKLENTNEPDRELIRKVSDFTGAVFKEEVSHRGRGDVLKLPDSVFNYPGFLADTLFGFWLALQTSAGVHHDDNLKKMTQTILLQYTSKVRPSDFHSLLGRPERKPAREVFAKRIVAFDNSLREESLGHGAIESNVRDATHSTLTALDAAIQAGLSVEQSLQVVARSTAVADLADSSMLGFLQASKETFRMTEQEGERILALDLPPPSYDEAIFSQATIEKLRRRDILGGKCPARRLVRLNRGGETHEGIKILAQAVDDRVGVSPPLIKEVDGNIYTRPGDVLSKLILLVIADNSL